MNLRFGPFTLDRQTRQLLRNMHPLHLSPKAFDLLVLLADRRPEAVAKAEIHERLWPDTFVSEVNVAVLITEIRTALADNARRPQFIRTVHRFGYAFCGLANNVAQAVQQPAVSSCWVIWGKERTMLSAGQNTLGRDPAADVRIDAVGVSRCHAMIVVDDQGATLHDVSSKNGTYVDGVRVTSPFVLTDGTEFRLGPVLLCFHCLSEIVSTQTFSQGSQIRWRK